MLCMLRFGHGRKWVAALSCKYFLLLLVLMARLSSLLPSHRTPSLRSRIELSLPFKLRSFVKASTVTLSPCILKLSVLDCLHMAKGMIVVGLPSSKLAYSNAVPSCPRELMSSCSLLSAHCSLLLRCSALCSLLLCSSAPLLLCSSAPLLLCSLLLLSVFCSLLCSLRITALISTRYCSDLFPLLFLCLQLRSISSHLCRCS
jgi:hypothetical protein